MTSPKEHLNSIIPPDKGYTEIVLNSNCGWETFYQTVTLLESLVGPSFTEKVNDFDSAYWSFSYLGSILTLHYNIYFGVTLFPRAFKEASPLDNENTASLGELLKKMIPDN
jgi:hypothetical protein